MAHAELDDGFHDHPKVVALLDHEDGAAAVGLWALCLSWAHGRAMQDHPDKAGHIPAVIPRRLLGRNCADLPALLVDVGLWEVNGSGWLIHDFHERVKQWRARSEAARTGAKARWSKRDDPNAQTLFPLDDDANRMRPQSDRNAHNRTEQQQNRTSQTQKQVVGVAARLPTDFRPSPESIAAIERKRPDVDWRSETLRFAAYWRAAVGKKGEKVDWQQTWRNWMTKARGSGDAAHAEAGGTFRQIGS